MADRFEDWIVSSGKKLGINYDQIEIVPQVTRYSSLMPLHISQVLSVFDRAYPQKRGIVIDATAHVGIDSLVILSRYGEKVYSIEYDPSTFEKLKRNCQNFGRIFPSGPQVSFFPVQGSCLKQFRNLPPADLLYFDPPWGGESYSEKDKLILRLGTLPVGYLIRNYLQGTPWTVVICKQPKNYDRQEFESWLEGCHLTEYSITKPAGGVSYFLIRVSVKDPFAKKDLSAASRLLEGSEVAEDLFKIARDVSLGFFEKLDRMDQLVPENEKVHIEGNSRANSRVSDYLSILGSVQIQNYCDVGCSEGSITQQLAKSLHPKLVSACDIDPNAGKKLENVDFRLNTETTLPFPSDTYDLLSMTMSAHHFSRITEMLSEVYRIGKSGSRIVIREHSTPGNSPFAASLDVLHALYSCVFGKESTPRDFVYDYASGTYAHYRTREQWIRLFASFGLLHQRSFEKKDVMKAFVALFQNQKPVLSVTQDIGNDRAYFSPSGTPTQIQRYREIETNCGLKGKTWLCWSFYTVKMMEMHLNFRQNGFVAYFPGKKNEKLREIVDNVELDVIFAITDERNCQNKGLWPVKSKAQNRLDIESISMVTEKDRLTGVIGDLMSECWLPSDFSRVSNPTFPLIVKPVGVGAFSNEGISVVTNNTELRDAIALIERHKGWRWVVCQYLIRPDLYQGKKYHLRAYLMFRSWDRPVWFPLTKLFAARKPYVETNYPDLDIHTTHANENKLVVFPDDFRGDPRLPVLFRELMDTLVSRFSNISPRCYPQNKYGWHVVGLDIMFSWMYGNPRAFVLEINDKVGYGSNEEAESHVSRFEKHFGEWEFENSVGDLLRKGLL